MRGFLDRVIELRQKEQLESLRVPRRGPSQFMPVRSVVRQPRDSTGFESGDESEARRVNRIRAASQKLAKKGIPW